MVSQCKVCGAKTAGHRQYCPDCRPYRVKGGRDYVSSRDNRIFKEFFGILMFGLVWVVVFWFLFAWVLLLALVFLIEFVIKSIFLVAKKRKIFTINSFEKNLLGLMKKAGVFFMSLHPPRSSSKLPAPSRTPFSYRKKLSNNLINYGSGC